MEERVFAVLFDESISELDIEIVEEREILLYYLNRVYRRWM